MSNDIVFKCESFCENLLQFCLTTETNNEDGIARRSGEQKIKCSRKFISKNDNFHENQ